MSKCNYIKYDEHILKEHPEALEYVLLTMFKNFETGPYGTYIGNQFSIYKFLNLNEITTVPKLVKTLNNLCKNNQLIISNVCDDNGEVIDGQHAFRVSERTC